MYLCNPFALVTQLITASSKPCQGKEYFDVFYGALSFRLAMRVGMRCENSLYHVSFIGN